jgi:hypothetical protein
MLGNDGLLVEGRSSSGSWGKGRSPWLIEAGCDILKTMSRADMWHVVTEYDDPQPDPANSEIVGKKCTKQSATITIRLEGLTRVET